MFQSQARARMWCLVAVMIGASPSPGLSQARGDRPAETASAPASRILSIGGDITEILYALGAEGRIVAVDSTSQFPPAALRDKKNVGYMRALSPEGVLSTGPDLVIASDRAGPADIVNTLKAATRYVEVPEGANPDGIAAKIKAIAEAIGERSAGIRLAEQVSTELATLSLERKKITKPLRALFVLSVQSGRATVGGATTSADAALRLAGLNNAAEAIAGFKPVGDEALLAMGPDLIVVMRRSAAAGHQTDQVLDLPGLTQTPAGAARRIVEMDGLSLLGFGPRTASAARDLMRAAYPEVAARVERQ